MYATNPGFHGGMFLRSLVEWETKETFCLSQQLKQWSIAYEPDFLGFLHTFLENEAYSTSTLGYEMINENDVLFSNDTGKLGKRNSEFSQQESNLQPSDY